MRHRPLAALLAVLLALGLVACAGDDDDTTAAPPATSSAVADTTPELPAFPVTVAADNGSVTLEEQPDEIVSLSATATESLFAIGAGDQVIAVDEQSNYPAEAPVTDLSGFQPNVEAIAGYEPDLVIAAYDPGGLVDGLEKLDIPVLLQDAPPDLQGAYEQIETLGQATGHVDEAANVVESMQAELSELAEAAGGGGATVYHELGPDFYSVTSETFIGSVYALLGLTNIADEAPAGAAGGYPQLTAEFIVDANPDLIVLADTKCCEQTAATVAKRPGWKQIDAVTQGNIVEADDDIASRWGPRTVDFAALDRAVAVGAGGKVVPRAVSVGWALTAAAFVVVATLLGLALGPVDLGIGAVTREVLSHVPFLGVESPFSDTQDAILWELRAPRVALGLLVGAMLASAGGAYQGVFRNPLADPYLLGAAAGAGLGATVVIAYDLGGDGGLDLRPIAAFAGATLGVAVAYLLGRSAGGRGTTTLILAGVTVAAFFTALQTFVQQRHAETVQEVYSWILGQLETSGWTDVLIVLPYVVLSSAVLLWHRRLLDVLAVGDDEAASLGVPVTRVRLLVVVAATLGTAAAVAFSGLIAFVGIIVPHAIRLMVGTSYRAVLPLSLVFGAGFLVLMDLVSRTVIAPAQLPIGVVTAFLGAPFFAVVLRTTRTVGP